MPIELSIYNICVEQLVIQPPGEIIFSWAERDYRGIVSYTEDELVSTDIRGNSNSCIIDGKLTSVVNNHVKLFAWFDNEYGFTTRMIDWLVLWQKMLN